MFLQGHFFKSSAVGARRRLAVAPGRVVGAVLDTDVLEPARRNVVALLIDVVVAARVFVRPPKLPVVAFRHAFVVDGVLLVISGIGTNRSTGASCPGAYWRCPVPLTV